MFILTKSLLLLFFFIILLQTRNRPMSLGRRKPSRRSLTDGKRQPFRHPSLIETHLNNNNNNNNSDGDGDGDTTITMVEVEEKPQIKRPVSMISMLPPGVNMKDVLQRRNTLRSTNPENK
jgi:hypothetical protein